MKEFDLEKAKAGHPVCTRDGRPARIICYDLKSIVNKPIEAILPYPKGDEYEGYEYIQAYTREGYILLENEKRDDDLMMAGVKKEGWVNIFFGGVVGNIVSKIYSSDKEAFECADKGRRPGYITTTKIEWEE